MRSRGILVLLACLSLSWLQSAPQTAAQQSAAPSAADRVIATYYRIFNAGLQNGNFSALPAVYAPNAILKHVTLKGDHAVFNGLNAISSFYQTAYKSIPGTVFKIASLRDLSPNIILTYDDAYEKGIKEPAQCAHVFVLQHGKIISHDWINFYPGGN